MKAKQNESYYLPAVLLENEPKGLAQAAHRINSLPCVGSFILNSSDEQSSRDDQHWAQSNTRRNKSQSRKQQTTFFCPSLLFLSFPWSDCHSKRKGTTTTVVFRAESSQHKHFGLMTTYSCRASCDLWCSSDSRRAVNSGTILICQYM